MALYNNGYPATYSYYTPVQVQPQSVAPVQPPVQTAPPSGLIWVQGEAGAKSYLVAPNNTVQLWDSENPVIYIKSADASGMPSMKVLDYTVRDSAKNPVISASTIPEDKLSSFATKDEIQAVSDQIKALRDRVDSLTRRRTRENDDE